MGRGLSADDVAWLRDRHPTFTLIKAEGSAVEAAALIERTGGRVALFNGRGGLEMIDVLHAGASGFLLAPDTIDHAVRVMGHFTRGEHDTVAAAYAATLPATVFVIQSIETLICYGKRLFAARAGVVVHDRAPALRPTEFGLACVARHAATLGRFGATR